MPELCVKYAEKQDSAPSLFFSITESGLSAALSKFFGAIVAMEGALQNLIQGYFSGNYSTYFQGFS